MKKHTKIYLKTFGFDTEMSFPDQYIPCEVSLNVKANDIHHIVTREDRPENLMALTRKNHVTYGEKVDTNAMLLRVHRKHLERIGFDYDNEWFEKWINHYEGLTESRHVKKKE